MEGVERFVFTLIHNLELTVESYVLDLTLTLVCPVFDKMFYKQLFQLRGFEQAAVTVL